MVPLLLLLLCVWTQVTPVLSDTCFPLSLRLYPGSVCEAEGTEGLLKVSWVFSLKRLQKRNLEG